MSLTKATCCGIEHICHVDNIETMRAQLADAEAEIARLDAHYREWQATLLGEYRKAEDALRTLRERLADAWDEGYRSGHSNAMRRMSDEPNAPTSPNPYRAALADAPAEATPPAEDFERAAAARLAETEGVRFCDDKGIIVRGPGVGWVCTGSVHYGTTEVPCASPVHRQATPPVEQRAEGGA